MTLLQRVRRRRNLALLVAPGILALSGCGMLDLNIYGAQHRAAVTWDVDANTGHTGPAESDPTRDSSGYEGCVAILDYYAPWHYAAAACHVNRDWLKGGLGYVRLETGEYFAP
jgi:hypothetical protein